MTTGRPYDLCDLRDGYPEERSRAAAMLRTQSRDPCLDEREQAGLARLAAALMEQDEGEVPPPRGEDGYRPGKCHGCGRLVHPSDMFTVHENGELSLLLCGDCREAQRGSFCRGLHYGVGLEIAGLLILTVAFVGLWLLIGLLKGAH